MRITHTTSCSICGRSIPIDLGDIIPNLCSSCGGDEEGQEIDYGDSHSGHCAGFFVVDSPDGSLVYVDGKEGNYDGYFDSEEE